MPNNDTRLFNQVPFVYSMFKGFIQGDVIMEYKRKKKGTTSESSAYSRL
jgi:hypothetical protein